MAKYIGYRLYLDSDYDGAASTGDGISGGYETSIIFTDHDMPLGSGVVTYPTTVGAVSGVFYEYSGNTYFVPDDDTGFPPYEAGTITEFVEAIRGTPNNDNLEGTAGDDVIIDTDESIHNPTGVDRIRAGEGDDTVIFGDGNDTIDGGGGNDKIGFWSGGSGNNLIDGGAGDDSIIGGSGDDQIIGGSGNDWLSGDAGRDTIDAGDGMDNIWVTDDHDYAKIIGGEGYSDWDVLGFSNWVSSEGVNVKMTGPESGTFEFRGSETHGEFSEIEHIVGTDYGDAVDLSGDTSGLKVQGYGGDDTIRGGSGADSLHGDWGNDQISGGQGADTLFGGSGDDVLAGGDGDDYVEGGEGSDTLTGGAGEDTLFGGDGNDVFNIYDADEDTDVDGGGWWDTIVFHDESSGEGVEVIYDGDGSGEYELGDAEGDFSDVEMIQTTQNADFVDASASDQGILLVSDDGADTVVGSAGADEIWAGDGEDSISGGRGADKIWGGSENDTIQGGEGGDTLKGEIGDDFLSGGKGNDVLYGGSGDDVFAMQDDGGFDVVHDFRLDGVEHDQLDVTGLTDASGNPVNVHDVTVGDDGCGNAVLSFPNGEGIQLNGIDPATLDNKTLFKMGIPCFAEGTRIRTPQGDIPIERLQVGDMVQTLDNGVQPIVWIGRRHLSQQDLKENPKLRPVRIRAGSLANDRDLIVSPQHGMVTTQNGDVTLARATHLARDGGAGFRVALGIKSVTYFHLMFEHHEVIIAENTPSESFYPGPMALNALAPAEIAEIAAIFPELVSSSGPVDIYGPRARRFLPRQEITRNVASLFEVGRAFA
ncbi:Hint domain-containing protein [Shimia haliotis]|uniref:Ca2+-binding protein, RTX toxin-related n=1 Tax=Shimia haliotis TaxID=1280847 RepID=A0A1I4F256_9RHOB|nr:Hint domain-containing protein [Shimia haliotis]SFL10856.1 Ca2+-binding protein, RTX toxin-related [Shimia haliotis]